MSKLLESAQLTDHIKLCALLAQTPEGNLKVIRRAAVIKSAENLGKFIVDNYGEDEED